MTRAELRGYLSEKCGEARTKASQYEACDKLLTTRTLELRRTETKRDECYGALSVFETCGEERTALAQENARLEQRADEHFPWVAGALVASVFSGAMLVASSVCLADQGCAKEVAIAGYGATALAATGATVVLFWRF